MRIVALTLSLSLLGVLPSLAAGEDLIRLRTSFYAGEKTARVHCIRPEEVKSLPEWSGEGGAPPLALEKAVEIARAAVLASYPEVKGLSLKSVQLEKLPFEGWSIKHWYYAVDFFDIADGKPRFSLPLYALVLLNGKVVPATAECAEAPGGWMH